MIWVVFIGINLAFIVVPRIIRVVWGEYWNILDCRWALREIPRGGHVIGGPPSTWPDHLKRRAYWPKKYGRVRWIDSDTMTLDKPD